MITSDTILYFHRTFFQKLNNFHSTKVLPHPHKADIFSFSNKVTSLPPEYSYRHLPTADKCEDQGSYQQVPCSMLNQIYIEVYCTHSNMFQFLVVVKTVYKSVDIIYLAIMLSKQHFLKIHSLTFTFHFFYLVHTGQSKIKDRQEKKYFG